MGGKEKTTLKEISEILGKETIDSFNTSETRGRELSHGLNYQKLGKQLMTEDEIAVMDGGKSVSYTHLVVFVPKGKNAESYKDIAKEEIGSLTQNAEELLSLIHI